MAFQPVPDTIQVTIVFQAAGTRMVNVLNVKKTGGYVQSDLDDLTEAVGAWVVANYMDYVNNGTLYLQTEAKGLSSEIDLQSVNTTGTGTVGAGDNGQANNVSKAFTLRTGFTGRSARGRVFMVGVPFASLASLDTVNSTYIDDIIELWEAFKTIVTGLGMVWVVVSRYNNGVKRTTAITTAVTDVGVSNNSVNSQRGRLG